MVAKKKIGLIGVNHKRQEKITDDDPDLFLRKLAWLVQDRGRWNGEEVIILKYDLFNIPVAYYSEIRAVSFYNEIRDIIDSHAFKFYFKEYTPGWYKYGPYIKISDWSLFLQRPHIYEKISILVENMEYYKN